MTENPQKPTPPNGTDRTRRGPKWLRGLLFLSLAANVLILGLVAGALIDGPKDKRVPRADRIGGPMTFALTHEDRRKIGHELRREYRRDRPSRAELRAEYQGVLQALRASPFDLSVIEASLTRQRNAASERITVGHEVLLRHIAGMSDAERAAFADRLEIGLERAKKHGPKGGDRKEWDRDGGPKR